MPQRRLGFANFSQLFPGFWVAKRLQISGRGSTRSQLSFYAQEACSDSLQLCTIHSKFNTRRKSPLSILQRSNRKEIVDLKLQFYLSFRNSAFVPRSTLRKRVQTPETPVANGIRLCQSGRFGTVCTEDCRSVDETNTTFGLSYRHLFVLSCAWQSWKTARIFLQRLRLQTTVKILI